MDLCSTVLKFMEMQLKDIIFKNPGKNNSSFVDYVRVC